MNKKKILAVVAAAAMTATMSLPVFAEDATPGEVANSNVGTLAKKLEDMQKEGNEWKADDVDAVTTCIKEVVNTFQPEEENTYSQVVTQNMSDAMIGVYENEALREKVFKDSTEKDGAEGNTVTYSGSSGTDIQLDSLQIDEDSVVLKSTVNGTQSDVGYIVEISMPGVPNGTRYEVVNSESDVAFKEKDNVEIPLSYVVENGKLTFWVPHFSTYAFTRVSTSGGNSSNSNSSSETQTSAAAPTATAKQASGDTIQYYTCPACGYHNWTATNEGYRCDNCGRIESEKQLSGYGNVKGVYEPAAAAVAENPIKATGSDMSLMIFAVVALAGVAACGLGVVSKKSRKGE